MRILLILITILMACSCGTTKQLITSTDQKDSTVVVIRDTTIIIDTVLLVKTPAEAEKQIIPADDSSHLETSVAESDAWVKNGQLHHELRNKPVDLPVPVKIPAKIHSSEQKNYLIKEVVKTVEVPRDFTHWQSFLMMLGRITLVIAILASIIKIVKRKKLF